MAYGYRTPSSRATRRSKDRRLARPGGPGAGQGARGPVCGPIFLPMKPQTNHDIFVKVFWEHVQFGWRFPERMVNRSEGYRFYRRMVAKLTQDSIAMIADPQERRQIQRLLEERYGVDLIPSEADLKFPGDPIVGDLESWQPAFDRLRALYGPEVGTSRRSGKDLRKYKPNQGLLQNVLRFSKLDEFRFRGSGTEPELVVSLQEFPREHLYRVESNQQTILEFDDWPAKWKRDHS